MSLNCPEWRETVSTHPPQIDHKQSGQNLSLPRLETIGVIGAGAMGVGLTHALREMAGNPTQESTR
jgi:NADH dehydrogenase FAD-containing subunit